MCDNNARPKSRYTLWLILQNNLMTTYRLQTRGIDVEPTCKLCQKEQETRDHIFVKC